MSYLGIEEMRGKLKRKRERVKTRYRYYEMKHTAREFGIATPKELRGLNSYLGWCAKSVDTLADRLQFRGFRDDAFDLDTIYNMNNRDTTFRSAILSALIASCSFLYISADETGYPRIQVIDGGNATGDMDPVTGLLREGYAVLERDKNDAPVVEAYFLPGITYVLRKGPVVSGGRGATGGDAWADLRRAGWDVTEYPNAAPYPLLAPIVFRPDAARPFGHSRISRACMSLIDTAQRTVKRSEITAEFYSFPQKYILGTDQDMEPLDKWQATISSMLQFSVGENGDKPTVGQFTQQSMDPHVSMVRMTASLFAGETGLTLDDLGFVTDNPSSAEAIKAAHENLRLTAIAAQKTFGTGFLNAGYLAACVRDNFPYRRQQLYRSTPLWEPVFEPDAAMLSSIGDGVGKINQAVPGYFGGGNLRDLTGIPSEA